MEMNRTILPRVIISLLLLSILCLNTSAQEAQVFSERLSYQPKNGGFYITDLTFMYKFINCSGIVLSVDYSSETIRSDRYMYMGETFSIQEIGAEYFTGIKVSGMDIEASLYQGTVFLGDVSLMYIVGFSLGCLGETYNVLKQVGKNPEDYKDHIGELRLSNIKITGVRRSGSNGIDDQVRKYIKQKKYDETIRKADALFDKGDFESAKEMYWEATHAIADDPYAKKKMNECQEAIENENQKKIDALKAEKNNASDSNTKSGQSETGDNRSDNSNNREAKDDEGSKSKDLPEVNYSANVADYSRSKPVYGPEWLDGELAKQTQIAQRNQYAAAQISGLVNNILAGEQRRQQFQKMVSGLTSISYNSYDPADLMEEYQAKTKELQVAYDQQAEETTMQMAAYLANENAKVSGEYASAQVAANNLGAMIAINSARKQIYEEQARKEKELDENLKEAMESLKSEVLRDIEKSLTESYDAALKALDPKLEAYFYQQYLCMECMKKEINRDFYYKSSEWLNTDCTQPRKPGIYKDIAPNAANCLTAAESKYKIYRNHNDENFIQASRNLVNTSLAYNKINPNAYYFKSILANNTLDALTNIKIAQNLDPQSQIISNRLKTIEKEFNFWFFESLKADNLTNISEAVKFKYHLGLLNEQGLSPIEYSINIDNARACRILFENEIDEAKTLKVNGYNYLFYAARKDANECFHLLTSKGLGADVIPDDKTTNAITIAASSQSLNILKDLIRREVDLDKQLKTYKEQELFFELSVLGRVYTEYAIENNRVDLMVPLAEYHPGVFKAQALSEPLGLVEYTLKNDNERVLEKFIVFGWNPTEEPDIIESCFEHRSVECLDFLLNYFSKDDFNNLDGNLFHFSVSRNTADMVPVLLKHNFDVNQPDESGNTPLTHAVLEGRDDCVQALIQSKAKLDQKNEKGWAPLHIAAKYNQLANCRYLCEAGADVNLEGDKKFTPLHYAAMENNAELCNALLASGASRNAKDDWGRTPYDIVKERKHIDLYKILK